VLSLVDNLNRALGATSLLVSHDIHETTSIADQIYIIADGRVIGEGSPQALRDGGSELVRQFMEGTPDGPVPFHYPADEFRFDILGDAAP